MKWIEHRLNEIGKTKGELAKCLDIPAARISDLVNGRRRLLSGELLPIADFLDMNISLIVALCHAQLVKEKSEKKDQVKSSNL